MKRRHAPACSRKLLSLVLDKHFNLTKVDLQSWARQVKDREPDIVTGSREEFEAAVSTALKELGTSHTAIYSEHPTRFPPPIHNWRHSFSNQAE